MTRAQDVREAIAEQSTSTAERRALEAVAGTLDDTLSRDVPYRPQFKAELRSQLMARARKQLTPPWYRRPAVWGTTLAAAAAVSILAIGLQFWSESGQPNAPQNITQDQTGNPVPRLVGYLDLPDVALQPDLLPAGHPGPEPIAGLDLSQGLQVYTYGSRADSALFNRMAQGLGFSEQPREAAGTFTVSQGARKLSLTADGYVTYQDTAQGAAGAPVDAARAQSIARSFLEQAALPVPSLDPTVLVNDRGIFAVAYTPRIDGRPLINGRTLIQVNPDGRIIQAEAYVQGTPQPQGLKAAIGSEEGLRKAQQSADATYSGVDLVYVRTRKEGTVYLQPYWRVYGVTGRGERMVRYVQALRPSPN